MSASPLMEMRNITKVFPGVKALDDTSFTVGRQEIHCLVGENGAGKSTLMKILSGVYPHGSYSGAILLNGEEQKFRGIRDTEKAGVAIIYQELALVPHMTVYENVFLGHEIHNGLTVDWNETIKQTAVMLKKVRLNVNPAVLVKDLSVGKQQLVEIAKALSKNTKLLILDEPTSALNEEESTHLLQLLRELKAHDVSSVLISHKLAEVIAVADIVTVLRDGKTVATLDASKGEVSETTLIKHMVGREINKIYPSRQHKRSDKVVLEVKGLTAYHPGLGREILHDVSFNVKQGEIVGFAGLMGAGRTELALSVFGNPFGYRVEGEVYLQGERKTLHNPEEAINAGLAYISEDRKDNGLILMQDVKQNITLANLRAISRRSVVNKNEEIRVARGFRDSLNIKTPSIEQMVINLSGGNQQKVSVAKWLFVNPRVLILDEPTRGIDVGAKLEIYTIMNKLVEQGMSIIMISSELLEILGMSDRVYVMSSGRLTGELPIEKATQEQIMAMATIN